MTATFENPFPDTRSAQHHGFSIRLQNRRIDAFNRAAARKNSRQVFD
jgi:hypothetical protein